MSKKIHNTDKAPNPIGPYNQSVWAGNILFISGQIAIDTKTGECVRGNITEQTRIVLKNLKSILESAGLKLEDIVKTTVFVNDMTKYADFNEEYGKFFDDSSAPAREMVEVVHLPKFADVEISAIAVKA